MSKQTPARPTGAKTKRPTSESSVSTSATAKPARPANSTAARPTSTRTPATMTAQQRIQTQQAAARQKKGGWQIRPLDVALLAVGVLVVGFVVWSIIAGRPPSQIATNTGQPGAPDTSAPAGEPTPLPLGVTAPDFSLAAADGKTYSLNQFKGKVVLLEFFAPWCPHCQDDAPMFNKVAERFAGKDVQFMAVSASPRGKDNKSPISMDDLTWFQDTYKVPFPMLLDKELTATKDYGVAFYPTVYMVDKAGTIASQPAGFYSWINGEPKSQREQELNEENLAAEIERLLAK